MFEFGNRLHRKMMAKRPCWLRACQNMEVISAVVNKAAFPLKEQICNLGVLLDQSLLMDAEGMSII